VPKKIVTKKDIDKMDRISKTYLDENPKIKEAMKVFNLSKKHYEASIHAKIPSQTITSSDTEIYYGNMARNQQ
jgi:hypothetical protein